MTLTQTLGAMRRVALAAGLICCSSGSAADDAKPPEPAPLVKVEVGEGVKIQIQETERSTRTSTFRVTQNRRGTPTADTLLLVYGFAKVAKARKAPYFTNLKEWSEKDGSRMYVLGFADSKEVDLREYFGDQYTRTNDAGQPRVLLSTTEFLQALGGGDAQR